MAKNVRKAMADPDGENIGGMYMEGPYINPKYGSNRAANPWNNKAIVAEDYIPIIEACADMARVWGFGPEQFALRSPIVKPHRRKLRNLSPMDCVSEPTIPMQRERL